MLTVLYNYTPFFSDKKELNILSIWQASLITNTNQSISQSNVEIIVPIKAYGNAIAGALHKTVENKMKFKQGMADKTVSSRDGDETTGPSGRYLKGTITENSGASYRNKYVSKYIQAEWSCDGASIVRPAFSSRQ